MNSCISCGMAMDEKIVSKHNMDYCVYCQDPKTEELKPYEEVRQGCITVAEKFMNFSEEETKNKVDEMLKKLPRWSKS
jgi:hypothetical protein